MRQHQPFILIQGMLFLAILFSTTCISRKQPILRTSKSELLEVYLRGVYKYKSQSIHFLEGIDYGQLEMKEWDKDEKIYNINIPLTVEWEITHKAYPKMFNTLGNHEYIRILNNWYSLDSIYFLSHRPPISEQLYYEDGALPPYFMFRHIFQITGFDKSYILLQAEYRYMLIQPTNAYFLFNVTDSLHIYGYYFSGLKNSMSENYPFLLFNDFDNDKKIDYLGLEYGHDTAFVYKIDIPQENIVKNSNTYCILEMFKNGQKISLGKVFRGDTLYITKNKLHQGR